MSKICLQCLGLQLRLVGQVDGQPSLGVSDTLALPQGVVLHLDNMLISARLSFVSDLVLLDLAK